MTKKYITVVFEYEQGATLPKELTEAFKIGSEYKDTLITAVSLEDEISRVDKLEHWAAIGKTEDGMSQPLLSK